MATNYSTFQKVSTLNFSSNVANALLVVKPEESFVHLSWKSSPNLAELTECADEISMLTKEYNIRYFLHDIRNVNYTDNEVQKCLAKVFCPQIIAAGVTRLAHLAQYSLPELMIIDQINEFVSRRLEASKKVKLEICTTSESAFDWLQSAGMPITAAPAKLEAQAVQAEEVAYQWALAAQVSAGIKQCKEKASLIFRILTKGNSIPTNY